MSDRLATMRMTCHMAEDYPDYKHKEIDKLPLYKGP